MARSVGDRPRLANRLPAVLDHLTEFALGQVRVWKTYLPLAFRGYAGGW